jgi:hypothetical protein
MTDEFVPDPPLSSDEARVVAALSTEFIELIDAELLKHARRQGRKVAMLVGLAMSNPSVRVPGLTDLYYAERIRSLVAKGVLLSKANLNFMRYSEVRLAPWIGQRTTVREASRSRASDSPWSGEVEQQSFTRQCIHIRLHAALVFIRPMSAGFCVGFVARLRKRRRLTFVRGLARCTLELERDT